MLSQEVEERLAERLVNRIEEANSSILKKIGEAIKQISTLSPSQAYQVSQILKYGGSYEEIAKELAKVSGKNVQDIYKIFDEVAKSNKQFAKEFYKYRGIDYIPYSKDIGLQNQVRSIASITAGTYMNIANTSAVGLVLGGDFVPLQQAYYDTIDKAILSVIQGKEDFYSSMRNTLKELGGNGLVEYRSGYKRRLDSSVRQNILDGIRQLNNETSIRFGQEYDADGIEISVHSNPAPDHEDIQGRQFSNEEYEKLENGDIAKDVKGNIYDGADKRHIGELNCYHKIFSIVLGVNKPEYTDEQLDKIKEDNENGFEFEGKHYTNYEGEQLQRKLELQARKNKDIQILAKASGDMELVEESQRKITILSHKYNDLCKASGLKPKKQRMSVSGYARTKVESIKEKINPVKQKEPIKLTDTELDEEFNMLVQDLEEKQISVDNTIFNLPDKELRNEQLKQLDSLTSEYNHNINRYTKDGKTLKIGTDEKRKNVYASSSRNKSNINFNTKYYSNKETLIDSHRKDIKSGWHYDVPEDKLSTYTITHEYGHVLEYGYYRGVNSFAPIKELDKDLCDTLITNAMRKLDKKITKTEFKKTYFSKYALAKRNYEWFAETFAKYKLSKEQDVWTETFGEWLEEYYNGR